MSTPRLPPPLEAVFYYIGIATTAYYLVALVRTIRLYTRPSSLGRYLHPHTPSWALVTGASDGIGYGLAAELASRGFDVLLHGRNPSKLLACQKALEAAFPLRQFALAIGDAADDGLTAVDAVIAAIGERHLTVLINNVGVGRIANRSYRTLDELLPNHIDDLINVNVRFGTLLTAALAQRLRQNTPSLIMGIGSIGSKVASPYTQVYCGTKAYDMAFTESLAKEMEMERRDIEVIGVYVGNVNSAGNEVPLDFFTPSSRCMAAAALDRVGCGRLLVTGYWRHALQEALSAAQPGFVVNWILYGIMRRRREQEQRRLKRL